MNNKQLIEQARENLPSASTYNDNYIEVQVTLENGTQEMVKFTKMISDGEVIWMDLPKGS